MALPFPGHYEVRFALASSGRQADQGLVEAWTRQECLRALEATTLDRRVAHLLLTIGYLTEGVELDLWKKTAVIENLLGGCLPYVALGNPLWCEFLELPLESPLRLLDSGPSSNQTRSVPSLARLDLLNRMAQMQEAYSKSFAIQQKFGSAQEGLLRRLRRRLNLALGWMLP